jgi:uncharacterized protein YcaQ
MEEIGIHEARRLALARAGLLKPEWIGFPKRGKGRTRRTRQTAYRVIRHFGYLQLDTVAVAGARSHTLVLLSRLEGFDSALGEELLQPGQPIFEYWGHEASWLPIELYPVFEFRRIEFRRHPWWGDLIGQHPKIADDLLRRIREEGPLRSVEMEGKGGPGWWNLKTAKRVATALWSAGELAVRERRNFQRIYDLTERVVPDCWRRGKIAEPEAIERLLIQALLGHGWATTGTLARTWRLSNRQNQITTALNRLAEKGDIVPCNLASAEQKKYPGWIRPEDLELSARLKRVRPRTDKGVLLSPFDPVLWDRARVKQLFDFDQILEIFKPAAKRVYGYYCLPILAGDRLIARVDLKADWRIKKLHVLSQRFEAANPAGSPAAEDGEAVRRALVRYAESLALKPVGVK